MLKPLVVQLEGQETRLGCVHWRTWPPNEAYSDVPVETLRQRGQISADKYAQFFVWKKVCGLTSMEESKCLSCPHVRIAEVRDHLPCLVTLDRKLAVPLIDRDNERLARGYLTTNIRPPGSAKQE